MSNCKYGCGREARYPLKSSKNELVCCESNYQKCPEVRKRHSRGSKDSYISGSRKSGSGWAIYNANHQVWNKGLTKETDERVRAHGEKVSITLTGKPGHPVSESTRRKISETVKIKISNNDWEQVRQCGRAKNILYNGVKLKGSWELKLAQFMDSKNIEWIRPNESFKYIFEGTEKRYFPDFYIPKFDCYIEVKGYETIKDQAKWLQFPHALCILKRKDIKDLDAWFQIFQSAYVLPL